MIKLQTHTEVKKKKRCVNRCVNAVHAVNFTIVGLPKDQNRNVRIL